MPVGGEDHPLIFAALRACNSAVRRSLGRLRGARVRLPSMGLKRFTALEHEIPPSGEVWTPARRAARWGRLWGYAPFSAPLASPPEAPPEVFSFRKTTRATRLLLRELPSLATLAQVISLRAA